MGACRSKHELRRLWVRTLLSLAFFASCLPHEAVLAQAEVPDESRTRYSTIRTLDFSKVVLVIRTNDELHGHLKQLALAELTKAGLRPAAARSPEVRAGLVVTLKQEPLPHCPGKVFYESGIEIWEDVVLPRDSKMSLEAVTWSLKPGRPGITEEKDIAALETELKWYIRKFAHHYNAFSAYGAR